MCRADTNVDVNPGQVKVHGAVEGEGCVSHISSLYERRRRKRQDPYPGHGSVPMSSVTRGMSHTRTFLRHAPAVVSPPRRVPLPRLIGMVYGLDRHAS